MPSGKTGRPPYQADCCCVSTSCSTGLVCPTQRWKKALYGVPLYRQFAGLDFGDRGVPDESTLLRFRHLLEERKQAARCCWDLLAAQGLMLKTGSVIEVALVDAPSSTKNKDGKRAPEMHQVKMSNQWHFGMKAHIAVDADSGPVHTVIGTDANTHDVTQATGLLRGEETIVWADAGYRGIEKRAESKGLLRGKRKCLDRKNPIGALLDIVEQTRAAIRAKVEHPFRVMKCEFGFTKVRYRGLMKNTAQLTTLFSLSNLWMSCKVCRSQFNPDKIRTSWGNHDPITHIIN